MTDNLFPVNPQYDFMQSSKVSILDTCPNLDGSLSYVYQSRSRILQTVFTMKPGQVSTGWVQNSLATSPSRTMKYLYPISLMIMARRHFPR